MQGLFVGPWNTNSILEYLPAVIPAIEIESDLIPLLVSAARSLDLTFEASPIEGNLPSEDYFAICVVKGAKEQTVTYPVIHHSLSHDRLISKPSGIIANSHLQQEMQIRTLIEVRKNEFSGPAIARFNTDGEFNGLKYGIDKSGLWSSEFAYTSVFENAIRAAHGLPLGASNLVVGNWAVCEFRAPANLNMTQPLLHLFAHDPKYRIEKLTSHSGIVAVEDNQNAVEKVIHAVEYLEGSISE